MSSDHQDLLNNVGALPNTTRMELVRKTRDELKADAYANGWIAKARKAIDQHRRNEGREARNADQRATYAKAKFAETGQLPRKYGEPESPEKQERRNKQKNESKKARIAAMSPDELKAYRAKESLKSMERRRVREAKERSEAAAFIESQALFG